MKLLALMLITVYQKTISPLKNSCCRFYPCCSDYAKEAVGRYGPLKGAWMSLLRICRCHPLNKGGFDPVR